MKIEAVAAQYMKLQPTNNKIIDTGTNPAESNVSNKERSDTSRNQETKIERSTVASSNGKLNELLNSEERKTISKLFGMDGMAKLNQILDQNEGRVSDLPRGILVNVKI